MRADLVPREVLGAADRRALYALFRRQFQSPGRVRFEADLDEKNWVLLLTGEGGELVGFSTLRLYESRSHGRALAVVYSGDTLVDPGAWSSSCLARSWIGAVNHLRRQVRDLPLYWLLLTSGFRTFRFLPVFWRVFFPAPGEGGEGSGTGDRARLEDLRQALAAERFGALYDPGSGIVRFPEPQVLRPGLRGIPPGRLDDPAIALFARHNPGHERGDELVCLTELSWSNLTRAGQRMWRAGGASVRVPEAAP